MESVELSLLTSNAALTRFERAAEQVIERKFDTMLAQLREVDPRPPFAFVTNTEASKLLGVSLATLAKWRGDGTLVFYKVGQQVYYKLDDLEALIEARRVAT